MDNSVRAPAHLWIVGGLAALWNAFGAFDYLMTQTRNEKYLAGFSEAQRAFFYAFPAWADAAWAFGVWGGLAGSLLLLARSRYALFAFGASLAGLLVTTLYQYGPGAAGMKNDPLLSLAIWAVAIALFAYAWRMRARGVLR
jgi:hypothetical protein